MKTIIKNMQFVIIAFVSMGSGCTESVVPIGIRNNSDQTIYYWVERPHSRNFPNHHYPDTILPKGLTTLIFPIVPGQMTDLVKAQTPANWTRIFSELPAGKFSIYFFTERPRTQEEWDSVRKNNNFYRKDVTYQELVDNDYIIDFP